MSPSASSCCARGGRPIAKTVRSLGAEPEKRRAISRHGHRPHPRISERRGRSTCGAGGREPIQAPVVHLRLHKTVTTDAVYTVRALTTCKSRTSPHHRFTAGGVAPCQFPRNR